MYTAFEKKYIKLPASQHPKPGLQGCHPLSLKVESSNRKKPRKDILPTLAASAVQTVSSTFLQVNMILSWVTERVCLEQDAVASIFFVSKGMLARRVPPPNPHQESIVSIIRTWCHALLTQALTLFLKERTRKDSHLHFLPLCPSQPCALVHAEHPWHRAGLANPKLWQPIDNAEGYQNVQVYLITY